MFDGSISRMDPDGWLHGERMKKFRVHVCLNPHCRRRIPVSFEACAGCTAKLPPSFIAEGKITSPLEAIRHWENTHRGQRALALERKEEN